MTIRLLVVEDHDLVREGLRAIFEATEIEMIGEATTVATAIRLAAIENAAVMLLDVKLPGGDGFDVLRRVKATKPHLAVLIYTQYDRPDFAERARFLGANGYLSKRTPAYEVIEAIRKASQGVDLWSTNSGCLTTKEFGTTNGKDCYAQ